MVLGCRCQKGRCRTLACPCYAAGRECDLDICIVCCGSECPQEFTCQNRNISTKTHKRVAIGISNLPNAGWGLFVREPVQKNEFIHEYVGEILSQEEAERRGAVYDKINRRYCFQVML